MRVPIDPQIQAMFTNVTMSRTRDVPVPQMREIVRHATTMLPPSTAKLAKVEDSTVPGPAGDIPVRIYTPHGDAPFPIVMFFHSGGWVVGDLDSEDQVARAIADQTGAVVVSVGYRLAPEHPFPAPNDDAFAATKWIAEHAGEYGGNAAKVAVAGLSAGGVLAVAVALQARDEGGPNLVGWANFYGSCDYPSEPTGSHEEWADGIVLQADDIDYYYNLYIDHRPELQSHPYVSPARASDFTGLTPGYIGTAECDPSRDHAEAFAAKLKAAGVDVIAKRYTGMIHGFLSWVEFLPGAREATTDLANWLKARFA